MNIKETLKKKAPTIMVVVGVAGTIGSSIWACKKTIKFQELKEKTKEEIDRIDLKLNDTVNPEDPSYDEKAYKKEKRAIYRKAALETAKIYVGPVATGAASIATILGGHKIIKNRYVAVSAAYATLETSFEGYRARVGNLIGEDKEYELYHNIETEEAEEEGKNGKPKKVKKKVIKNTSFYDIEFSKLTSSVATGDIEYDKMIVAGIMNEFDTKLKTTGTKKCKGKVLLGDIDKALGLYIDEARWNVGKIVGWEYDPDNPEKDCAIVLDVRESTSVDGSPCLIISFNVDGRIVKWD